MDGGREGWMDGWMNDWMDEWTDSEGGEVEGEWVWERERGKLRRAETE